MSSYTTTAALAKRAGGYLPLAQLASDATPAYDEASAVTLVASGTPAANIAQAIEDASLLLDQWLNGTLDMTVTANQTAVEQYAAWIAMYFLHCRRYPGEGSDHEKRYKAAEQWAKDVRKRDIKVAVNPESPEGIAYSTTGSSDYATNGVMSDTALENF